MVDFSLLRSRFQNKLRALNVSWECLSPVVLLPAFIYTAAVSRELSILLFLALPILFCVVYVRYQRTRFFYVWSLWSVLFGYVVFQSTVPMIELLPEENIIFLLFVVLTVFLFYKTKSHAFNKAYWPTAIPTIGNSPTEKQQPGTGETEKLLAEDSETDKSPADPGDVEAGPSSSSSTTTTTVATRVYQCSVCQTGVPELDHHNVFLDCCIGGTNRKFYLLGCIAALITLLLEANLSLTSICHPYLIFNILGVHVLMPDDCSDVYDQYDLAVCFVLSVYCLMLACYVLATILYQVCLISRGLTAAERKLNIPAKHKWNIYRNWMQFFRN